MQRREFLKYSSAFVGQSIIASTLLDSLFIPAARGSLVPLRDLQTAIRPDEGLVLVPSDTKFAAYGGAFNKRTLQTPTVRVLCATPQAVAVAIQWAQTNGVPMAVRSGGHSYEGQSQSTGLVIDTRPMANIEVAQDRQSFVVGAGAQLGNVYTELSKYGRAVPAGTCPTVGITGHTLGGGYGMLARPFGLACDSLISASIVNADGRILSCSASENQDLFWALRGGGAGSFGIVTKMQFKTHAVERVRTFGVGWKIKPAVAGKLMKTWQQWAPSAPRQINILMKVSKGKGDLINVRCVGQTVGTEKQLRQELARLTAVAPPESLVIKDRPLMDAVRHFGGSFEDTQVYMKGKSDYLKQVMSDEGIAFFLQKIPYGIDVLFDAYGGTISDVPADETAFVHRAGTVCSLQYYTQWATPNEGPAKLATMKSFHDALRPYMSGSAYFNYCDLDIADYGKAYWGNNLERLSQIKSFHDPKNFFKHSQSIPLKV